MRRLLRLFGYYDKSDFISFSTWIYTEQWRDGEVKREYIKNNHEFLVREWRKLRDNGRI